MDVGYWRSSHDALQTDYLAPSCYLIHRAGALRLKPDVQLPCRYSVHGRASDDAIHRDVRKAMAANSANPSSADILMINCRAGLSARIHCAAWLYRLFCGHHLARSHSAFCRFRHRSEKGWETCPWHIPHSCGCKHNSLQPAAPLT